MIRLAVPSIEEDDLQAVREVLLSGYLVQGPRVAKFEKAIANYVGTKYAVAVSNCTAALHLALLSINVRPGDLVIVTSYSWISTANVIELCGAQPVFVDIRPDTFNMDPECLSMVLDRLMAVQNTARRVKAILPVHTFGQMANMPAILEVAGRYSVPVIEDAACALGGMWNDRQAGAWGAIGCFSFHPRKAIATGEGGIITTNDENLVRLLRALRNHGQDSESSSVDFIMPGYNYRMTEYQAAMGLTQLRKLDRIIARRRLLAGHYDDLLAETSIQVQSISRASEPVFQSFVVLPPNDIIPRRSELIHSLRAAGIEITIGTWHMPMTTYFRSRYGYRVGDFPITDQIFARSITLPMHEKLLESEQAEVIGVILNFIGKSGRL